MTVTDVCGISLQAGDVPDMAIMIVHLTMKIPVLELIGVIPDLEVWYSATVLPSKCGTTNFEILSVATKILSLSSFC